MENRLYSMRNGFKKARKRKGLSQAEVAEKMGVILKTVMNWEQGISNPDLETSMKLSELFDCDLDYLTGRIDEPTHDIKSLCELSGLTPAAAEIIQKRNLPGNMTIQSLSALIESEQFSDMMVSFFTFLSLCKEYKDHDIWPGQFKFLQTDGDRVIMTADEAIYHYMNKTAMIMQGICEENLRKIHNDGK